MTPTPHPSPRDRTGPDLAPLLSRPTNLSSGWPWRLPWRCSAAGNLVTSHLGPRPAPHKPYLITFSESHDPSREHKALFVP